jgi:hypothetical protein
MDSAPEKTAEPLTAEQEAEIRDAVLAFARALEDEVLMLADQIRLQRANFAKVH